MSASQRRTNALDTQPTAPEHEDEGKNQQQHELADESLSSTNERRDDQEQHTNDIDVSGSKVRAHPNRHGGNGDKDGEDEFAEEDAWLRACHFLPHGNDGAGGNHDDSDADPDRYVPQLMDTRAMRELRATLHKSEQQVATCGRMRDFVPRKPVTPSEQQQQQRGAIRGASSRMDAHQNDSTSSAEQQARTAVAPSTAALDASLPQPSRSSSASHSSRKEDFALVLRRELRQLRELELRYDETKRMLLEHMDAVCSLKPSERVNSAETYEKLAELLAFAAECEHPTTTATQH